MPIGQFREWWRIRRGIAQLSSPGSIGRLSYFQKLKNLFGSAIIGYWPGNEESGTAAIDYSGNGYNGVYTGVTLGQPGIGDGQTCPLYDGANDYMQPPAGFRSAFNGNEGSILLWAKSTDWTLDTKVLFNGQADADNLIVIFSDVTNNTLLLRRRASALQQTPTITNLSNTGIFYHFGMVWSDSGDYLRVYLNGAQVGVDTTGLATFVGTPAAATTVIGALNTTPANVWSGNIAHPIFLKRAATHGEMAAAAVI